MSSRRLASLSLGVLVALGASGCGAGDEPAPAVSSDASSVTSAPVSPSEALERIADGARVIDVRTAEEFAAGHVDGAVNLDVQQADFEEQVSELPREESYVVYCASGRRASGAVEKMTALGFNDVVNGGGYDDLAEG
jgi:phage shock protein E